MKKILSFLVILIFVWAGVFAQDPDSVAKIWSVEYKTLWEAVVAAQSGDVIDLLKDISSKDQYATTLPLDVAITINKSLTLKGNGFTLFRPKDYLASLFEIGSGVTVNLEGVKIDGNAPGWSQNFEGLPFNWYINVPINNGLDDVEAVGSVIINKGKLFLHETKLENMLGSGMNAKGVGIKSLKGSELSVENSEFKHIGGKQLHWWWIFVENNVKLQVKSSVFDNNSVPWPHYFWGAIYVSGWAEEELPAIKNSEFKNCHAMNGGALRIGTSAFEIRDSKFISNSAGNDGSAIQFGGNSQNASLKNKISVVENTLFSGNIGLSTGDQSLGTVSFGGYYGVKTQFDNSEFINNLASAWGAIADFNDKPVNLEFNDCHFIGNRASGWVFFWQDLKATVNNGQFYNNEGGRGSVAILYDNSSLELNNSIITENKSHGAGTFALYADAINTTPRLILGSWTEVKNNIAKIGGGVFGNSRQGSTGAKLIFEMQTGSKLYNNTALSGGDDLYFYGRVGNKLNFILQKAEDMEVKDKQGLDITSWFTDYSTKRYIKNQTKTIKTFVYDGDLRALALKAANETYTIHYEGDNPSVLWAMSNQEVVIGVETWLVENRFSLAWYEFSGWVDKTTGSGYMDKQMVKDLVMTGGNSITLHATWREKPSSSSSSSWGGYSWGGGISHSSTSSSSSSTSTPSTEQKKPETPVKNEPVKTEQVKTEIFNPTIQTTCFNPLDKQTIDQGNKMSELLRIAHQMLYSYSLTKWQGTKDFAPERSLTREEAARFMTEFATNVLCRKASRTYNDHFTDLEKVNPELLPYIKKSYEYLIFNGDSNAEGKKEKTTFRPKELITVGELSAIMTRLVRNELLAEVEWDRSKNYRTYINAITPKSDLKNEVRGTVAEVIYDLYRNNDYELKDIGYVIKK